MFVCDSIHNLHMYVHVYVPVCVFYAHTGLDNSLRVFAIHKDVQMNMELSQGEQ